jgi:hypothetical protein
VTTGLSMVDSIRAADFNARHLLLALDAGDPYRVARAVALEAGFLGSAGARQAYERWAAEAGRIAEQSGHPHAKALCALSAGVTSLLFGEWRTATEHCAKARRLLRAHCAGAIWETNCADVFYLGSLLFQGEIREVSRQLPELLAAARDRGNLYFETELRTRMNLVWLAADQADEGERHANEAMERWSHNGFYRQHYNHTLARGQTELYRGRAEQAWRAISSNWKMFERTLLLRIQFQRIEMSYLRGRAALLMAARGHDVKRFLSIAQLDANRIASYPIPWSQSVALLLRAGVSHLRARPDEARQFLTAALDAFERLGMNLYAAATRRRLAELQPREHAGLLRQSDEWMAAQEIRNPGRITRLIAPGFADRAD